MQEGFLFSISSPVFICRICDYGHSDWCEVISHCCFNLHFSNNEQGSALRVFIGHVYVVYRKCLSGSSVQCLIGLFVFLVLNCMSCFYISKINPLSVVSLAIIFSHSEGCLFTLLIVSFVVQKLLSLIRLHLFILFPLLWELGHRGSCCNLCRRVFCLFFP